MGTPTIAPPRPVPGRPDGTRPHRPARARHCPRTGPHAPLLLPGVTPESRPTETRPTRHAGPEVIEGEIARGVGAAAASVFQASPSADPAQVPRRRRGRCGGPTRSARAPSSAAAGRRIGNVPTEDRHTPSRSASAPSRLRIPREPPVRAYAAADVRHSTQWPAAERGSGSSADRHGRPPESCPRTARPPALRQGSVVHFHRHP